jgi:hypothetical protein
VNAPKASLTLALHRIRDTWLSANIPSKRSPDGASDIRGGSPSRYDIPDFAALSPGYGAARKRRHRATT